MKSYQEIDRILNKYKDEGFYASAVCKVFDKDCELYAKAVGDVNTDTWFDMASVSKIVCTTMNLFLMEEGKFTPDDKVLPLLPAGKCGPVTIERLKDVTVEQLMTHTSGIVPWFPFYSDGRDFYTVLERVLSSTSVEEGMAYSDLNFMLMGQIFSNMSGLSLREGLDKYIKPITGDEIAYGPVDVENCAPSCWGNQIEQEMCRVRGLSFDGWRPNGVAVKGGCNDGNAFYYWGGASGHAGIFASAGALVKLCRYYMNTDKPFFIRAMETNICERGLGFDKTITFPEGCGHTGFTGTSIWFSRKHNVGAVLLTNKYFSPEGGSTNCNLPRRDIHYWLLGRPAPIVK